VRKFFRSPAVIDSPIPKKINYINLAEGLISIQPSAVKYIKKTAKRQLEKKGQNSRRERV